MKTKETERYLKTFSGRELLGRHSLDEVGIWKVLGEDPNCDLGGSHIKPDLGTFEGKLLDILNHGTSMKGFWQWGVGGDFIKVKIQEVVPTIIKRKITEDDKELLEYVLQKLFDASREQRLTFESGDVHVVRTLGWETVKNVIDTVIDEGS